MLLETQKKIYISDMFKLSAINKLLMKLKQRKGEKEILLFFSFKNSILLKGLRYHNITISKYHDSVNQLLLYVRLC